MPVVAVNPKVLYELMGVDPMTQDELDKLLNEFGLELDDVVEEDGVEMYKIDIAANRADILCAEGLAVSLKAFLGKGQPTYKIDAPKVTMNVDKSVDGVRPVIVCAVIRNINFDESSYRSFIDFQEKLHQNLCRRRTLASIGTHDLDVCKQPFSYTAEKPEDIVFVPLTGGDAVNGHKLFENLSQHQQLSRYLYLLDGMEYWPVVRDGDKKVMSLPPIINSDYSRITTKTRNVFIECTALDYTRALTAVIALCAAFSIHCDDKFTFEQVNVVKDGKTSATPEFKNQDFTVDVDYIRNLTSVKTLTQDDIIALLAKMQLVATKKDEKTLIVSCPPTRADVLHPCDIAEDVAISYGYNRIAKECRYVLSAGRPQPMWEYVDRLSKECAASLWNQILTFSLCSRCECYSMLNIPDDGLAATIKNAATVQFEIVRTNLLGGLLKVNKKILSQPNLKNVLPLRLFEISDVCFVDKTSETNVRNEKHFCATICDVKSRFDQLHGLLDRFFILNRNSEYKLEREDTETCIKGQRAAIYHNGQKVGWIGVIHPTVLINFELTKPVVALEVNVEPFVKK